MSRPKYLLACCVAVCAMSLSVSVVTGAEPSDGVLDPTAKSVEKLTVTSSQIGFRDTLVFYTFKDQKVVLKVSIDNKSKKFPVSGIAYLFADDVTEEGLKMWLNNQHSDGLFPEVPEPVTTVKIPADACKVATAKYVESVKETFGEYDKYTVEFEIRDIMKIGPFVFEGLEDEATVYLKKK
jgi:hypothetical protein